jgi:hypothetical protein
MMKMYKLMLMFMLIGVVGLSIAGAESSLRVLSVDDVSPSSLSPGESETLKITIKNDGDYDAENVVISWIDSTNSILPVGTGNTKTLGKMSEGDSEKVEFNINADASVEPGLYQISITMTYLANNETVTQDASLGIKVGGDTNFEIIVSDVDKEKLSLSVINVGSNPAKAITVKIPKQDNYEPLGSAAMSLGKLASDDYIIVPFDLKVVDGNESLEVEIAYTDTDGDRQTVSIDVDLEQYEIDVLTGANIPPPKTDYTWPVIGMLAMVVAVIYFYKRYKRKQRESE